MFLAHLCELLPSLGIRRPSKLVQKSSPLKPLGQFISDSHALHPRWPPLLKKNLEISSNGHNCFILSQNVPKFELYKHNDELFNIYYVIFYEL